MDDEENVIVRAAVVDNALTFYCPACACVHAVEVTDTAQDGTGWGWNGSLQYPTLELPVLIETAAPPTRCHSQIISGRIFYEDDCSHGYTGMRASLPPLSVADSPEG